MKPNKQKPTALIAKQQDGDVLLVHSIFPTIQGEGPFSGHRAVFIRLGGCNLQCPGCDTEYSRGAKEMSFMEIYGQVIKHLKYGLIVITGGEPFRQNLRLLVNNLLSLGYRVQIETNGTLPPSPTMQVHHPRLTIVCSPKTGMVNQSLQQFVDAYKYVGRAEDLAEDDGLPIIALGHTAKPRLFRQPKGEQVPVYLQPMDEQDEEKNRANMKAIVASCQKHGYILCLQTHKIIGVE